MRRVSPVFARHLAASLLLTVSLTVPKPLSAQEASLEGRDLNPVSEAGDAIANAIVDLLGSPPEGKIRRVTVLEDRQKSLRLGVEYEGFGGNWLKAKVQRAENGLDDVTEITSEPVELDGSGTAELVLELSDGAGEGFEVDSDRLALVVTETAHRRSGTLQNFYLEKRWANAVRAENVVIDVRDRPLTSTATGYQVPPRQGERFVPGARDQEVEFEYRVFRTDRGSYLSAPGGGGGNVVLNRTSQPGPDETFEVGWLDREERFGRVRTSDGWHLLALRDDGTVDARSIDPADPATILYLEYASDGGGTVIHRAPAAAAARFADRAAGERGRVFVSPVRPTLSQIRQPIRTPNTDFTGQSPLRRSTRAGGGTQLALRHSGGLAAVTYSRSAIGAHLFRSRRSEAPEGVRELRLGEADGPGERTIDLANLLHTPAYTSGRAEATGPTVPEMLGVNRQIWLDRNETSGIYYFLPSAYHLKWDPDRERYALDVEYLSAAGQAESQALVQATLTPGVGYRERRAIDVLARQAALGLGLPFVEVRPMDITTAATTDRVAEQLGRELGADSVWVAHPQDVLDEVRIGWRMPEARLDNFIEVLRSGQGVQPTLHVQPRGRDGAELVNLNLSWQDPQTYPGVYWENSSYWRNVYPHPVRLKSLQALVLDREDRVMMLSWDLSGTDTIPPGARAGMGNPLPGPVIENAFFTWVEYDVLPTDATTEATVRSLMSGVSESLQRSLEVVVLDAISGTGAARVQLFVRSPYLQPDGQARDMEVLSFEADGQTESVRLYLGRADAETPYEWTAILHMPDGRTVPGGGFGSFVAGDRSLQLFLSSSSLRKAVGDLPDPTGGE